MNFRRNFGKEAGSIIALSLLSLLSLNLGAGTARAELLVGTTRENLLLTFDSNTPGAITTVGFINGLVPGDELAGIDRRPSLGPHNGQIYALGFNQANGSARVYILNETTAVATLVSTLAADPGDITGTPFNSVQSAGGLGIDFDPVTDRLRVVTDLHQNLSIDVDSGLVQVKTPVTYSPGDLGAGGNAMILGLAFTSNFGGAGATSLRGLDVNRGPDWRVTLPNPDNGLLQSSAALPFDASDINASYDISGLTATGYFVINDGGSRLYRDDVGGATLVGFIGGGRIVRGLAASVGAPIGSVSAPEPASFALACFGIIAFGIARHRQN